MQRLVPRRRHRRGAHASLPTPPSRETRRAAAAALAAGLACSGLLALEARSAVTFVQAAVAYWSPLPASVTRAPTFVSGTPPAPFPRFVASRSRLHCGEGFWSLLEERPVYEGWGRLQKRDSWDFIMGSSPFNVDDDIGNLRRQSYMDNLLWVDEWGTPAPQDDADGLPQYPASFTAYLSRMFLARDECCHKWWLGAKKAADEAPEVLFARFEASVAYVLRRHWRGRVGQLAALLMKRFGNRYPFDGVRQTRLCFTLLPEKMLQNSYFDQEFHTERDEFQEIFSIMDKDKDGKLSKQEIRDAFKLIGGWLSEAELKLMMGEAYANADGEVGLDGFKAALVNSLAATKARAAQGIPEDEWWRDPAALLPAEMLERATPAMLREANGLFREEMRRVFEGRDADPDEPPGEEEEEEELEEAELAALPPTLDAAGDPNATAARESPTPAKVVTAPAASAIARCGAAATTLWMPRVPPLMRERNLGMTVYALFMAAGAVSCTLTHVALVPIDVVKTLQQTEPSRFAGRSLLANVGMLWQSGPSEFFLGMVPTLFGYMWYGAFVFPGYEFFKRLLGYICGPRLYQRLRVPLVLLAGALATVIACVGVCPAEAVRIKTVRQHGFQMAFLSPFSALYAGFAPLVFRQVLFGMAKFLVFDTFAAAVYRRFPKLGKNRMGNLLVSLLSGATAGLVATFVSQPSDAILTKLALSPKLGITGAARALVVEGGFRAFFTGFATRSIWAASIIAGQFVLYDIAKQLFKVTSSELMQTANPIDAAFRNCSEEDLDMQIFREER